ncbi:eclosion hormone [Haemaphysalis longicornis]
MTWKSRFGWTCVALTVVHLVTARISTRLPESTMICIENCGQCKIMYGEYFSGSQCAEECVSTVGFIQPDCDIADTIVKYLRKKPRLPQHV